MYFGPPWITWSNLEYTQPPIWLPVFIQRDSPGGAVGGGIPIRRSSVEIISSFILFYFIYLFLFQSTFSDVLQPTFSKLTLKQMDIMTLSHSFIDSLTAQKYIEKVPVWYVPRRMRTIVWGIHNVIRHKKSCERINQSAYNLKYVEYMWKLYTDKQFRQKDIDIWKKYYRPPASGHERATLHRSAAEEKSNPGGDTEETAIIWTHAVWATGKSWKIKLLVLVIIDGNNNAGRP